MVVLKKNSCRICQKVFCCPDCRDNHENSKHPKPKCSLCLNEALPYKVDSREDSLKTSELVSHVLLSHQPLRCKLCGDRFKSSTDFLAAQNCRWWNERRRKQGIGADANSIIRGKPENLDSPPADELVRHTSTPMHQPVLALPGQKLALGATGLIPQFCLKTPTSSDQGNSLSGSASSNSAFESRYYTGISELSSAGKNDNNNKDLDRKQLEVEQSWSSPTYYSILKKQLEPLNVLKSESMDSIEKRVRFSDQCIVPDTSGSSSPDNDVFFEARESLDDEMPKIYDDDDDNNNNDNVDDKEESLMAVKSVSASAFEEAKSEACGCYGQANTSVEKSDAESKTRVVMMLLVEKVDSSKNLSSLDLAPLIESGLKKLEEGSGASKLELTERKTVIKDTFFGKNEKKPKQSLEKQRESKIEDVSSQVEDTVNSGSSSSSHKSDGIFSAMARAVIGALKMLPAVGSSSASTSRNLSREPLPQAAAAASSVSSLSIASSCSTTTSSRLILQRSASKRPRDRIDSGEEQSQPQSGQKTAELKSPSQEVVSSPAAKRHRGWYRIRAREPIARMRERQLVPQSPRGASRETQRFQQGSLMIGDIFLPLPSRAHQSTQTDD